MYDPSSGKYRGPDPNFDQLDTSQLPQVAQVYIERFKQLPDDPQAQRYAQTDPATTKPTDLQNMHQHLAQHHPGVLDELRQHPVITAAVAGVAGYEVGRYAEHMEHAAEGKQE